MSVIKICLEFSNEVLSKLWPDWEAWSSMKNRLHLHNFRALVIAVLSFRSKIRSNFVINWAIIFHTEILDH